MQFSKKALIVAIVTVVGVLSPGSVSALHTSGGDGVGDLRHGLANKMTVDGQPQVKHSQGEEEEQGRQHTSPPAGKLRGGTLRQSTPEGKKEEQRNDNLVHETPNNGLSTARIVGTWYLSATGPNIIQEVTGSMEWTNHQESTTETTRALTTSVSAGFDFEMHSASTKISGTAATTVGRGMELSFSLKEDQTYSVTCPQNDEYMSLWKWNMHQEENDIGPGFESNSYHYICTVLSLSPKCPLLDCKDSECQTCVSGTTALAGDSRSVQDTRVLDY